LGVDSMWKQWLAIVALTAAIASGCIKCDQAQIREPDGGFQGLDAAFQSVDPPCSPDGSPSCTRLFTRFDDESCVARQSCADAGNVLSCGGGGCACSGGAVFPEPAGICLDATVFAATWCNRCGFP
jgi:hypothetical protein